MNKQRERLECLVRETENEDPSVVERDDGGLSFQWEHWILNVKPDGTWEIEDFSKWKGR